MLYKYKSFTYFGHDLEIWFRLGRKGRTQAVLRPSKGARIASVMLDDTHIKVSATSLDRYVKNALIIRARNSGHFKEVRTKLAA